MQTYIVLYYINNTKNRLRGSGCESKNACVCDSKNFSGCDLTNVSGWDLKNVFGCDSSPISYEWFWSASVFVCKSTNVCGYVSKTVFDCDSMNIFCCDSSPRSTERFWSASFCGSDSKNVFGCYSIIVCGCELMGKSILHTTFLNLCLAKSIGCCWPMGVVVVWYFIWNIKIKYIYTTINLCMYYTFNLNTKNRQEIAKRDTHVL